MVQKKELIATSNETRVLMNEETHEKVKKQAHKKANKVIQCIIISSSRSFAIDFV